MVKKQDFVNALFVLAFPFYGIGKYMAQVGNFSIGQTISILPGIILLVFFLIDSMYSREFQWKLNWKYGLVLGFIFLTLNAIFTGLGNSLPGLNSINSITLSIFVIACLHAPLIVQFYNKEKGFSIEHLLYLGLTLDIGLNLLGYALGIRNAVHSIDGRLNLPFGQGFYAAANTVAILNLLILAKLLYGVKDIRFKAFLLFQLGLNFILMMGFNSRLSILIFTLVSGLLVLRIWKFHRLVYLGSLLTIPFLLSFSEWIFKVMQMPIFSAVLKRVSYQDITGFNGRRDLWEAGLAWITEQGQGFLLGNGYRGHYVIGLLEDLERFWFKSAVNMHMHSSFLEYTLSMGLVGILLLLLIMYLGLNHLAITAGKGHRNFMLIGVFLYLAFLFQIDNYVYIFNYGAFILFTLVSATLVTKYAFSQNEESSHIHSNTVLQSGQIYR